MHVELSELLKLIYPNLSLIVTEDDKVLSICSIDKKRCLDPNDHEEDYSYNELHKNTIITRVFTAFSNSCTNCKRKD